MSTIRSSRLGLFAVLSILAVLASSQVNAAIFVDIPGIPGESIDSDHRDQINALSASGQFELDSCGAFTVAKKLDRASPRLIASVVRGDTFISIVIEYTAKSGKAQQVFSRITLNNATITSLLSSTTENVESWPVEQFLIEASSIDVVYNQFTNTGSSAGTISETVICGMPMK